MKSDVTKDKRNTLKRSLRTALQSGVGGGLGAAAGYLATGDWSAAGAVALAAILTPVAAALQNWAENSRRGGPVEEN